MAVDSREFRAAVVLQANIRGFLLRKQLGLVQKEFEEVVSELEDESLQVTWSKRGIIGYPVLTRKAPKNILKVYKVPEKEESSNMRLNSPQKTSGVPLDAFDSSYKFRSDAESTEHDNRTSQLRTSVPPPLGLSKVECTTVDVKSRNSIHQPLQTNLDQGNNPRELSSQSTTSETGRDSLVVSSSPEAFAYLSSSPVLSRESVKTRQDHGILSRDSVTVASQQNPLTDTVKQVLTESWMTDHSFEPVPDECEADTLKQLNRAELQEKREKVAMELLWIQQAIDSRKNYLRLKKSM